MPSDPLAARRLEALPEPYRSQVERTLQAQEAHRASGHLARAVGASLEDWLEAQHREAIRRGIVARLSHVGPPVAWVHKVGGLRVVAKAPGPADYQGQTSDGRALAIEAKSCEGRLSRRDLTITQAADLTACATHNGIALLVWEHREAGRVTRYAIPWLEVPWHRGRRGKDGQPCETLDAADAAPWAVRPGLYLEGLL